MQKEELQARLNAERAELPGNNDSVEKRFKEIQDELAKLDLQPSASTIETRTQRYQREQRIKSLRKQLDRNARYPMQKRVKPQKNTILVIGTLVFMVVIITAFGGVVLSKYIGKQTTVSSVTDQFWSNMQTQNYYAAHAAIDPRLDTPLEFDTTALNIDQEMGNITAWKLVSPLPSASSTLATLTYSVSRKGGTQYQKSTLNIVIKLYYSSQYNTWYIYDIGNMLSIPQS